MNQHRYKLSGSAAVKSKNVYLSIVDNHQTLCKRGIVQLFNHPHPPKQYQTIWTSKTPPRIYSQNEIRQRTRSTEDLSNKYRNENDTNDSVGGGNNSQDPISRILQRSSSKNRTQPPNIPEDAIYNNTSIERSTSLHANVQKSQNQIILPKDYNPIAALNAVENMEIFLSKTFYSKTVEKNESTSKDNNEFNPTTTTVPNDEGINAFTNKIFSDRFEENLMKDTKRLHNLNHKNLFVQSSTRNYKQIISNQRQRELQIVACIIVEIFLANKIRALGLGYMQQKLNDRIETCKNVLKTDYDLLPKCVQYPVKLLFSFGDESNHTITDIGLPKPSANQMLQPFLSTFLFPFPNEYLNTYTLLRTIHQYESANQLLDCLTFIECERTDCGKKNDNSSKNRTLCKRKIAECKVMACAAQCERLLNVPRGYEQFNVIELILPHIIDLLTSENTSILAAWFLFDSAAIALGQKMTRKYLLEPMLKLYDAESDERLTFLNSNFDSSMKFTNGGVSFKSRKTIKLYHHSFLLRLIVRFGLSCFLDNFVPPLIEAIGGCKESVQHSIHQYHETSHVDASSAKQSNKSFKMGSIHSIEEIESKKPIGSEPEEMFTFENELEDLHKAAGNIHLTDSSDNDADNMSQIIDQFDTNSNEGETLISLK